MDSNINVDKLTELGLQKPPVPLGKPSREDNEVELEGVQETSFQGGGFLKILFGIITDNIKNAPLFLKRNIVWMGPLLVLWIVLWQIKTYTIPYQLAKFLSVLIFLTATYNNFLAKGIFMGFIYGSAIPIFKDVKREGFGPTLDRYKRTLGVVSNTFKRMGNRALPAFLFAAGIGLAFSNYLSRNNKADKYFICLITGFIFFRSMSKGTKSIQIRLFKALVGDIFTIMGKKNPMDNNFVYVFFTGLSTGFAGSIISALLYGALKDNTGYILGTAAMLAGIVLHFVLGKPVKISSDKNLGN